MWLTGAVALVLPWVARWALSEPLASWAPWFNGKGLNWLGLVARKPYTEDYVPVFPWLGVMWWDWPAASGCCGIAAAGA